jgi:radical SAM enzyme (TIGR01210 family)
MPEAAKGPQFSRPIYLGKRTFFGLKDLVIAFYTERCPFRCAYCNLPAKSHDGPLATDWIKQQIDWSLEQYADELDGFQQLSVGNEGSILDRKRFPSEAMTHLLQQAHSLSSLQILSLETRPEYISVANLRAILDLTSASVVDVTIGFETQDDHLRQVILNKSITRKTFEARVKLLGEMGVRLTSYVLLKPGPTMTEEQGIREAILTIHYIAELCDRHCTDFVIYLNPAYAAKGTPLARAFAVHQYRPPRIQSIVEVIRETRPLDVRIYVGLWSEGNAEGHGDYTTHEDYQPEIRTALKQFNKTQAVSVLQPYFDQLQTNQYRDVNVPMDLAIPRDITTSIVC